MNSKIILYGGALFIIILLIIQQYYIWTTPRKSDDEVLNRIESKLDSLSNRRDSVKTIIIKIDNELIENEKHYEEVVNTINAQPFSGDSMYILDYLDRLYPSKTNKSNIRGTREIK